MNRRLLFIAGILTTAFTMAQAPQGISHQVVIRDSDNELVTGSQVGLRVSILEGHAEGDALYSETHTLMSNANGLIAYVIGEGQPESGDFEAIDWSDGPFFLKTEADPDGGNDYSITGVTQFLSVPFAFHATTADYLAGPGIGLAEVLVAGNDAENQPIKNLGDPDDAQDAATKAYVDLLEDKVEALLDRIEALEFNTGLIAQDVDGNVYDVVTIGNQLWMAENLRVTRYRNGDEIPTGLSAEDWEETDDGAFIIFDHDHFTASGIDSPEEMADINGKLYNWHAVNDSRGLCPEGWRVPGSDDRSNLIAYLEGQGFPNEDDNVEQGAGNALKSCRQINSDLGGECNTTVHPRWRDPELAGFSPHQGFNEFGFNALPGAYRRIDETLTWGELGGSAKWWTTEEYSDGSKSWYFSVSYATGHVSPNIASRREGLSIRCVRDAN